MFFILPALFFLDFNPPKVLNQLELPNVLPGPLADMEIEDDNIGVQPVDGLQMDLHFIPGPFFYKVELDLLSIIFPLDLFLEL